MKSKRDAEEPPRELWDALASRGYMGVNIPEEYGGGGLGMQALSWVGEEIAAAGCSLLLIVVSPAIVGSILTKHGTPAQKDRWLTGIGAGTTKIAFAITEADAGSNSHKLSTSLRRDGERYLLNGQKTFISASRTPSSCWSWRARAWRAASSACPRWRSSTSTPPGFTRQPIPMAIRGADRQWTLFFDDVELEEERLIGGENGGLGVVFDGLNPERIMGASISTGVGRLALERGASYAREREVWGQPIGAHQAVAHPLAEAKIQLELARLMTRKRRLALRRRRARRRRVGEHGQVRGGRGRDPLRRQRDPGPRRQRLRARVRAQRPVVGGPRRAHRAGLARDGPQLRRRALARPAEVLLALAARGSRRRGRMRVRAACCWA